MEKIRFILAAVIISLVIMPGCTVENTKDELYDNFVDPPARARPFVRWWWNGNCVEEGEIERELDVMKAAGIGGVEINPIRMPVEQDLPGVEPLQWISPEWNHAVKTACERAKENGMLTDLIVGSGWPFGGEFLESGEIIQRVLTNHKELVGPSDFIADAQDLMHEVPEGYRSGEFKDVLKSRILFISLVPEELNDISECLDLASALGDDGKIRFKVPEGNYRLIIGVWQEGHRRVTYGAPGSDGPVLDHLNAAAVQKYLDRLSDALEKEFGAELGAYLRALFCDSIELAGANWTTDFSEQFYNSCGYRLEPYLPFLFYRSGVGYKDELNISPDFALTLQRVRYDYNRVLVSTFLDRLTMTFKNWCNDHGALCRYQAYGLPWLVGISEGYMIADIPEGNGWLNRERYFPFSEFNIWNKYASSSGHVGGKPIISCEAMSNLDGVFKTPLEQIKQADDMNFITGINHTVLHGYNYSPPEAGFPGWLRFGTYFNEQNTWWPYFRLWSDYNARLSTVFQTSTPLAEVAILGPTADVWGEHGLWRDKFHETPWYCYQLWRSFSQNGITADYVNETMIQNAAIEDGELGLGEMKYQMLVLTDVKSILPATAKLISEYAANGGKVVFVNTLPGRSPSMVNAVEDDAKVEELIRQAVDHRSGAVRVDGPGSEDELISWTSRLLETMKVDPSVRISQASASLFQVHQKYNDRDIFFFSNQNRKEGVQFAAGFTHSKGVPWRWDPETGTRTIYHYGKDPQRFNIELGPLESLLIVFEKRGGAQTGISKADESEYITIDSPWNIHCFPHIGSAFQLTVPELPDLASPEDERLNSFAGIIEYTTALDLQSDEEMILDLGKVYGVSEVSLNGKVIGIQWYGTHRYSVSGTAGKGISELKVKVTTTLYNYCRTQEDNPEIRRWLKTKNAEPSGMTGPVRLYSMKP